MYTQSELYRQITPNEYTLGLAEATPTSDLTPGGYLLHMMLRVDLRRGMQDVFGAAKLACQKVVERESGLLIVGACGEAEPMQVRLQGTGDLMVPDSELYFGSAKLVQAYAMPEEQEPDPFTLREEERRKIDREFRRLFGLSEEEAFGAEVDEASLVRLPVRRLQR